MVDATTLLDLLTPLPVCARRLWLHTPGVMATVPMIRGTFGAALHALDRAAYDTVFEGGTGPAHTRQPGYILRPAPPDSQESPAIEWLLIGGSVIAHDAVCLRAWDRACGMGLGKRRESFTVRGVRPLGPGRQVGALGAPARAWSLGEVAWPLEGDPASMPCRLTFPTPLRLLRHSKLISTPTYADLIVGIMHRLRSRLSEEGQATLSAIQPALLEIARAMPTEPWVGERLDLHRYSARQARELEFWGVTGYLQLPSGPGPCWPLLAAAEWLHLGKSTIVGLGQLRIEPYEAVRRRPVAGVRE